MAKAKKKSKAAPRPRKDSKGQIHYRDAKGHFIKKTVYLQAKHILTEGIYDKATGKELKPTYEEAIQYIFEKRIKHNTSGEKKLQTIENEIEYYLKRNPGLKIQITDSKGKTKTYKGREGYKKAVDYFNAIQRKVTMKHTKKDYPGFLHYEFDTLPGSEDAILLKFDVRDAVDYEGDLLFDSENENDY